MKEEEEQIEALGGGRKREGNEGTARAGKGVKKGFFGQAKKPEKRDEVIKPKEGGKGIPEGLKVDPESVRSAGESVASKLTNDTETLQAIMHSPELREAFNDPEVMTAVNEIAKNPGKANELTKNPKVANFYRRMSGLLGERLETMGQSSSDKPSGQSAE